MHCSPNSRRRRLKRSPISVCESWLALSQVRRKVSYDWPLPAGRQNCIDGFAPVKTGFHNFARSAIMLRIIAIDFANRRSGGLDIMERKQARAGRNPFGEAGLLRHYGSP